MKHYVAVCSMFYETLCSISYILVKGEESNIQYLDTSTESNYFTKLDYIGQNLVVNHESLTMTHLAIEL